MLVQRISSKEFHFKTLQSFVIDQAALPLTKALQTDHPDPFEHEAMTKQVQKKNPLHN